MSICLLITGLESSVAFLTTRFSCLGPFDRDAAYFGRRGSTTGSFLASSGLPTFQPSLPSDSVVEEGDQVPSSGFLKSYLKAGRRSSNIVGFDKTSGSHASPSSHQSHVGSPSSTLLKDMNLSAPSLHSPLASPNNSTSPSSFQSPWTAPLNSIQPTIETGTPSITDSPYPAVDPLTLSPARLLTFLTHSKAKSSLGNAHGSAVDVNFVHSSFQVPASDAPSLQVSPHQQQFSDQFTGLNASTRGVVNVLRNDGVPAANKINLDRIASGAETRLTVMIKGKCLA